MSVGELEALTERTEEQEEFIANYYRYIPVIISNSPMNLLCRRIENLAKEVNGRAKLDEFDYSILRYPDVEYTKEEYKAVTAGIKKYLAQRRAMASSEDTSECGYDNMNDNAERELLRVLPDVRVTVNVLIDYFYRDYPTKSRDLLWGVFGRYIISNLTGDKILLPSPDEKGDIEYLGERYSIKEYGVVN